MAAAANMGKPCPTDPVWYRLDCTLAVRCEGCGHRAARPLREWVTEHRISQDESLWRVIARMRCTACHKREPAAEVKRV